MIRIGSTACCTRSSTSYRIESQAPPVPRARLRIPLGSRARGGRCSGVVSAVPLYLALAAGSAPWWWPLLTSLLREVSAAGEAHEGEPQRKNVPALPRAVRAVAPETRTPLNRVLAFQGVGRRVSARRRWEGGFGRRGL